MHKVIEEADHLVISGAFFIRRERLRIPRRDAGDAAEFRTSGKSLGFKVRGEEHFLETDRDVTSRFTTDADHFPDFLRSGRRRFFDPNMGTRPHAVDGKRGKNGQVLGVVTGNNKNHLGLFRRKHLVVIGVGSRRAEKAGATCRPLPVKVADRHEIHRREGKDRVDVTKSVPAGADEAHPQFAGVFVIVSNVRDKENLPELFVDHLAIRRTKDNEEERFRLADVGGSMPHVRQNGDRVSRLHFGFRLIGHCVANVPLNNDQDFAAVRVIVARIAAAGFEPATAHREVAGVTESATGVPGETAPFKIEFLRLFGRQQLNSVLHEWLYQCPS
jgi:hypothetical protein